jgi:hypothetical protein
LHRHNLRARRPQPFLPLLPKLAAFGVQPINIILFGDTDPQPARSDVRSFSEKFGTAKSAEVESFSSKPAIACNIRAQSATLRANTPPDPG